ncbi:CUE domain-containing protein 1b isoform X5 [Latimeria chalumnae]|uniref:CUE domain-containing protein 1b isoform X5 n=1 Tax=Latimeria chalumnae TaxID=7897 RepID=UPI0006D91749|nr:PREDICTED: CUE domain-containing protein 1 isoform X5 [Latimeria chalumnae]|eukprot:XP_014346826.1 PREDICTED: CUE domain-containing protein 1 isoform X5 [Latimeria chalumnae]
MTSLFRRSSSNGGSRSSSSNTPSQELNNSRPARQVRRLEFNQAMEDFKIMFPNMDYDVIECVLRANNGAVDATIDQLLQMNLEGIGCDDSSDSDDSIPPEILERTLEPDSSDEEPPPVYSPPAYDMHIFDRQYPQAPPTPPPRFDVHTSIGCQTHRRYRNWNPPLLGNLPDDFLRILPQQMDSVQSSQSSHQALNHGSSQGSQRSLDQERKLKQYLEDERIALFLQNEEFMRELQRNREFLMALEKDRLKYESKKSKSNSSTATRKKLFELARAFSEKTKMRKPKRKHMLKHQALGTAASTANLLDDVEGNPCDEDVQFRRQPLQEEELQKE